MRVYETTFILSPQADDAAFDRQIKAISELINRYNGKVLEEDRWGVRRLAYAIKKFTQGYYTRIVFEGNNALLKELDRFYRLEEPYIRNLTVGFEGELKEKEEESDPYQPRASEPDTKTDSASAAPPPSGAPATEEKPATDTGEEPAPAAPETTDEPAATDEETNAAESSDDNVDNKEEEL